MIFWGGGGGGDFFFLLGAHQVVWLDIKEFQDDRQELKGRLCQSILSASQLFN